MKSSEILELVSSDKSGLAGAAMYHLHSDQKSGYKMLTRAQRMFAQNLHDQAVSAPRPEKYRHPAADATRVPQPPGAPVLPPLSEADLAWLGRLPRNPEQVSYSDAVALAGLALGNSKTSNTSESRLVQSIWAPVKEFHDARAAEVTLRNARARAAQRTPEGTLDALADALSAEVPDLWPEEAYARARTVLDQTLAERDAKRQQVVSDAQAAIAKVGQETVRRTSNTYVDPNAA